MKKILLFLLFFSFFHYALGQDVTIWKDSFDNQIDKGFWGGGNDMAGVTDWTVDVAACALSDAKDYAKVASNYSNGRFEARDNDGEAVWESQTLDISSFSDVKITADVGQTGGNKSGKKIIQFFYILDNGLPQLFDENGENTSGFEDVVAKVQNINGKELKIRVILHNNYANDKIFFDNLLVVGAPKTIAPDDTDSEIVPGGDSSAGNQLFSVVEIAAEAQEVFRFKIKDSGTSDGKPTEITKIILQKGSENTLDWTNEIIEATLQKGTAQISAEIFDNQLVFDSNFSVDDGTSETFLLYVKTAKTITDRAKFQCKIDVTHGFLAKNTGSTLKPKLSEAIVSDITTLDVQATALRFKTQPSDAPKNTVITPPIEVEAIDAHANLDTDFCENITLSATNILGTTSQKAETGTAPFSHIYFSTVATNITLLAQNDSLGKVESDAFNITDFVDESSVVKFVETSSATAISPNEEKSVFFFAIEDKGGDDYPTKVTEITITVAPDNELSWKETVQDVVLLQNETNITCSSTISEDKIILTIPENNLTVAEGTSATISLAIQLATADILEGKTLQFQIAGADDVLAAPLASSRFAPDFGAKIVSPAIKTEIRAKKLKIASQPTIETAGLIISEPLVAHLEDEYGNLDVNNTSTAKASVAGGTGVLLPEESLTQPCENGVFVWDNLSYNKAEIIRVLLTTETFSTTTQEIAFSAAKSTEIIAPKVQISEDTIAAQRNTAEEVKAFFSFIIEDKGDDGLPTEIHNFRFQKAANFSEKRLYYLIGGMEIRCGGEMVGKIEKLNASNGYSDIVITPQTPFVVEDGRSKELTAFIYLSTHEKLKDRATIQLEIAQEHGWKISSESSGFITPLENPVRSPIFTVDAVATQLQFTKVPAQVTAGEPFSVIISAVDNLGNIDTDYDKTITLAREAGTGILISAEGLTKQFTNGTAIWTDLSYSIAGNFTLLATSKDFTAVESKKINARVLDAEILPSSEPIVSADIRSIISSEDAAQKVFSFAIKDHGNKRKQPTIINKLTLKNTHPENGISWKSTIAGAVLFQDKHIIATTDNITNEAIIFNNSTGVVTIADGKLAEMELAIYLKYNNIQDNKVFQCKIAAADTDWQTKDTASSLKAMSADILSAKASVRVIASQVDFLDVPMVLGTASETFSVVLGARDSNGNIDTDYNESVIIANTNGTATFENGKAVISNVQLSDEENLILTATSDSLKAATHQLYVGDKKILLNDGFESGLLDSWENTADWKASVVESMTGKYSLKHSLTAVSGSSRVVQRFENLSLSNGTTVWRWQMKNGDFNPSSTNNFHYVLAAASATFSKELSYVVGINKSGSTDLLTLWECTDSECTPLIVSEMVWQANGVAGIEVRCTAEGRWSLLYDNNGGFDNLYQTGTVASGLSLCKTVFSGLVFNYETASRAGLFWADDFYVYQFSTAPKVDSLKVISATELQLFFNQEMKKESVENVDKYIISKNISVEKAVFSPPNIATLTIGELATDTYQLKLSHIENTSNISIADTMLNFNYIAEAKPGEVVINELMIDENPSVKLPDYEYIELYNVSKNPFVLTNWKITVNGSAQTFSTDTIQPDEYIILCSGAAQEALSFYGKTVVFSTFPALTNSRGALALQNASGVEIDKVNYEKVWYNDKTKHDGGWSLERITPEDVSNSRANWAASMDSRGGTPGEKNSVFGTVLDSTLPTVKNIIPTANQLNVLFSEPIDTLAINTVDLFELINIGKPSAIEIHSEEEIALQFATDFSYGTSYSLIISEIIDLLGNASTDVSVSFSLPELAEANEIIINEILFNPISGGADYVEFYNPSNKTFNLSTVRIATREKTGALKSMYWLTEAAVMLNPGAFVVVTTDSAAVSEQYYVKNPEAMLAMKTLPSLPDASGVVLIVNQEGEIIDEFAYADAMHSSLIASTEGVSLERINYYLPTQNASNWQSAAAVVGYGTPTYENSAYADLSKIKEENITISPKSFSPNGDGVDDQMQIHYTFEKAGAIANVIIFDSSGRKIVQIANNLSLATRGIISWDGSTEDGNLARSGRYIVFVEVFDAEGNVERYKKTCVLFGKFK